MYNKHRISLSGERISDRSLILNLAKKFFLFNVVGSNKGYKDDDYNRKGEVSK